MRENLSTLQTHPAYAALSVETAAGCLSLLAGLTGTHALLLDAGGGPTPQLAGLSRWTTLQLTADGHLDGPLCAEIGALPFSDGSFSAVVIRHVAGAGVPPEAMVGEAMRVLASHGVLVAIEFHPYSLWGPWLAKRLRHGEASLRTVPPGRWQSALGAQGSTVRVLRRCGAPWPRVNGMHGLPRWSVEFAGAVYVLKARKRDESGIAQRLKTKRTRTAREQVPWAPGARRTRL